MENSNAGSINKAYDLLNDYDLRVHGETNLRVQHTLMTLPGQSDQIKRVRSHPQALAQCEDYLNAKGYIAEAGIDTAGSAKDLSEAPEVGVGVIASRLAAEMYGLEIVEEGIEDYKRNFTRFFVIGKGDAEKRQGVKMKTSVVFAVIDAPSALMSCLQGFSDGEINLLKLESRPRRRFIGTPGFNYVFYLDFEGHYNDEKCASALLNLMSKAAFVKL